MLSERAQRFGGRIGERLDDARGDLGLVRAPWPPQAAPRCQARALGWRGSGGSDSQGLVARAARYQAWLAAT